MLEEIDKKEKVNTKLKKYDKIIQRHIKQNTEKTKNICSFSCRYGNA